MTRQYRGDAKGTVVAHRKDGCAVCSQLPDAVQQVNAAIWDGQHPTPGARTPAYRSAGQAVMSAHGATADVRTVTRHAEHTEASARSTVGSRPRTTMEMPVFPTDFVGVTERLARLGMAATERLHELIEQGDDSVRPADLVAASALALRSVTNTRSADQRDEALRLKERGHGEASPAIMAIFVHGAGMAPSLSEHDAIDVTPLSEMRDAMRAEMAEARRLARG